VNFTENPFLSEKDESIFTFYKYLLLKICYNVKTINNLSLKENRKKIINDIEKHYWSDRGGGVVKYEQEYLNEILGNFNDSFDKKMLEFNFKFKNFLNLNQEIETEFNFTQQLMNKKLT